MIPTESMVTETGQVLLPKELRLNDEKFWDNQVKLYAHLLLLVTW